MNIWYQHPRLGIARLPLCGLSLGLLLGPIVFLLFINDLPNRTCISKSFCNVFADDYAFYAQAPTINSAQANLQNYINNVVEWFDNNRLHVNVSKSSCMMAFIRHNYSPFTLSINDTRLDNVDQFKYLGVQLTNTLSWNVHISMYAVN